MLPRSHVRAPSNHAIESNRPHPETRRRGNADSWSFRTAYSFYPAAIGKTRSFFTEIRLIGANPFRDVIAYQGLVAGLLNMALALSRREIVARARRFLLALYVFEG